MNFRKYLVPAGILVLVGLAWRSYGWQGVFAVGGGLMMWALLHFTRLMNVMNKAAQRPIGHVGSAVMLNARLREGVNLMHVVAMTRSLGQPQSPEGEDPEIFRWTDGTQSHVTCEFRCGRLVRWELVRPAADDAAPQTAQQQAQPAAET
ncbi:glycerate kinase [Paracidovorax wautersii]|uniref:glycerate kinase n=1 Tax=Paracidovorax wautersii TaxID=1177982 RepID=UPI0031E16804